MKKLMFFLVVVALLGFMYSPNAQASSYGVDPGDQIMLTNYNSTSVQGYGYEGGFFAMQSNKAYSWLSFCVETKENISPNTWYTVQSISDNAYKGGNPVSDPIDNATAWLFLKALGFGNTLTLAEQADYQAAIWYIEGEKNISDQAVALSSLTAGAQSLITAANGSGFINNGQVQVVSLGTSAQDVLIASVPEPFSLLLLGLGLFGLGITRKIKK